MNSNPHPDAKVLFRVSNEDGTSEIETLWATSLGDDKYRLENSPFWAYGVSWKDVVFAPFSEYEGFPSFNSVVSKSGNCTVRVFFDTAIESGNESEKMLQVLVAMGCSWEGMNSKYVSVNIPPSIAMDSVCNYLNDGNATWEHAAPTYASLFPDDA